MFQQTFTFDRVVRIIIGALILIVIFLVLQNLESVLFPFFMALLVAYLINPLANRVQRWIKNRALAVLTTLFSLGFLLIFLILSVAPMIKHELSTFSTLLSQYGHITLPEWMNMDWLPLLQSELNNLNYKEVFSSSGFREALGSIAGGSWYVLTAFFGFMGSLLVLVSFLLYLVFILLDYQAIATGWKDYIPSRFKDKILILAHDVEKGMSSYFKAQSRIVFSVAIMFAIGFKLIGLPMGILLGVFVGLLNYVPYLQIAGIIPAVFLGLIHSMETGTSVGLMIVLVFIVFGIVQLIQDAFLTPKIMGDLTGLNPAVILLSLSIWGYWLGIVGMIIALPMTTLIISYYKRFLNDMEAAAVDRAVAEVLEKQDDS